MKNYHNLVIKHYENTWNNEAVIKNWDKGPVEELSNGFCVLEFAPTPDRDMWTYATCGMSSIADAQPMELHMFSPSQTEEMVELLTVVAHYHQTGARLNLGHTVNFGKPWQDSSRCNYGLISLPYLDGPDLENLEYGTNNFFKKTFKVIKFYWLIPISEDEIDYKKKYGLEALEEKFDNPAFNYVDPNRVSVV